MGVWTPWTAAQLIMVLFRYDLIWTWSYLGVDQNCPAKRHVHMATQIGPTRPFDISSWRHEEEKVVSPHGETNQRQWDDEKFGRDGFSFYRIFGSRFVRDRVYLLRELVTLNLFQIIRSFSSHSLFILKRENVSLVVSKHRFRRDRFLTPTISLPAC